MSCPQEPCDNDGKCVDGSCSCNDGFVGSKCEIGLFNFEFNKSTRLSINVFQINGYCNIINPDVFI